MKRKFVVLTFMLSFLAFISNELKAQSDAYFYTATENRSGLSFDYFDGHIGDGFNFGYFDEIIGNGFEFDNLDDGANGNTLGFGNIDMAPDEVPLNDGMLLLLGFALTRIRRRRRILGTELGDASMLPKK